MKILFNLHKGCELALKHQLLGGSKMSVEDKIVDIIAEQLSVDRDTVIPQARFSDDLGADSLDLVEMVLAFEEEFGVEIPDEEAEKMRTVQNALDFIKKFLTEE